ncbi:MAG: hydantoinase B/oxoprolinase family protein [Chloroflexi bacterium]|nr:hydantoinase B/oxoprolinase family protein [Chloroflexota bacterium]
MPLDPITIEVIANRLMEIVNTMQHIIFRTGYSTIVRESKDTSAAIADVAGNLVGQATQHPLHLGIFTPTIEAILRRYPLPVIQEGDSFVVNDPYIAGSPHVPDFIVATPAFYHGKIVAFCLCIAHKPDVGGSVPGSSSGVATEIFQEGIILPPVRYYSAGILNQEVEDILRNNSRVPDLIVGDLRGQVGCTRVGVKRIQELCEEYDPDVLQDAFDEVVNGTERRVRRGLGAWPDGVHEAEGYLDHDGIDLDRPVRLHVVVTKKGEDISFDFSGSDDQTRGPVNIRPSLLRSACHYALVGMIDPTIANNHGVTRVVKVICRDGSVVNPRFPAPVNHYAAILGLACSCILTALGEFVPEKATAAAGGGSSISIGGSRTRTGQSYVQYELFGSGYGARRHSDGVSGTMVDAGNCKITPVEIIETEFPVRLNRFELARDSGGAGKYRGGLSFLREYETLEDSIFTLRGAYYIRPKWGIFGGKPGALGWCTLNPGRSKERKLPSATRGMDIPAGTVVRLAIAGAGGYGEPHERDAAAVLEDVLNGYVSLEKAREDYGVIIDAETFQVDVEATRALREELASAR